MKWGNGMKRTGLILLLAMGLASCASRERTDILKAVADGQPAKVRLSGDRERRNVSLAVRPASLSYDVALRVAEYRLTEYCIKWTGSSAADWTLDDNGLPVGAIDSDKRVFRARCRG
jgi:hypothetical protein